MTFNRPLVERPWSVVTIQVVEWAAKLVLPIYYNSLIKYCNAFTGRILSLGVTAVWGKGGRVSLVLLFLDTFQVADTVSSMH